MQMGGGGEREEGTSKGAGAFEERMQNTRNCSR